MGQIARKVTKVTYQRVIKPLLFKASPDTVHTGTVRTGCFVQGSAAMRSIFRWAWAHQDARLKQTIHGVTFLNPVGLAAGFDKNVQLQDLMASVGFGFMTGGSITGEPCEGNPRPWFHRLPQYKSLAVHAGLANHGSDAVARTLKKERRATHKGHAHLPLSLSVARTNSKEASTEQEGIQDYIKSFKTLRTYPDMFELNISCPNTYGGEPFTTPDSLEQLLTEVDGLELSQPLYIKMPSDLAWPEFALLLDVIVRHNVQGVTICNLRKDRRGLQVGRSIPGGLSGLPVQQMSDTYIYNTYKHYGDKLTIIGVGGIFSAEDAYRKVTYGASLVGMVTGLVYEGPQVVGDINTGLVTLLHRHGYQNISEAIGTAVV